MQIMLPWRDSGCPYRRRNHDFVIQRYRDNGFEPIECDSGHRLFNRSAAKNVCVTTSNDDVIVISDTDIVFEDLDLLLRSVTIAREHNKLVLPIYELYWLPEKETVEYLQSGVINSNLHSELYLSGGVYVVPRNVHEALSGYDEKYSGWGYEDIDYYMRHNNIFGEYLRVPGLAYHLWHPVPPLDKKNKRRFRNLEGQYSAGIMI